MTASEVIKAAGAVAGAVVGTVVIAVFTGAFFGVVAKAALWVVRF